MTEQNLPKDLNSFNSLIDTWHEIRLIDHFSIATGNTPPSSHKHSYGGEFLFAGPSDLGKQKYIYDTEKKINRSALKYIRKFPKGSTLFTCIGSTIGKTGLAVLEMTSNQQINAVFPNHQDDCEFIYYALTYRAPIIKLNAGHQAVPIINKNEFGQTLIKVPKSASEQQKIATALSDTDALISELEKLIEKKQVIKTATMQQLLTGKTRLPEFALREDGTPKDYKGSALGQIPEDWEVYSLKSLLKSQPKYGINAAATQLSGDLPTYIRITDIDENGKFNPSEKVGVDSPLSGNYILDQGDIVLARTGASVGKSYLYDKDDGELVYAGFLIKISPAPNLLCSKYLSIYLQTKEYWDWIATNSMRSGQPGINGNQYASLKIVLPSFNEQLKISRIFKDIDRDLEQLKINLDKVTLLKQGMMQELLTGKTRLV